MNLKDKTVFENPVNFELSLPPLDESFKNSQVKSHNESSTLSSTIIPTSTLIDGAEKQEETLKNSHSHQPNDLTKMKEIIPKPLAHRSVFEEILDNLDPEIHFVNPSPSPQDLSVPISDFKNLVEIPLAFEDRVSQSHRVLIDKETNRQFISVSVEIVNTCQSSLSSKKSNSSASLARDMRLINLIEKLNGRGSSIRHPNLVRLHRVTLEECRVCATLEYNFKLSLYDLLLKKNRFYFSYFFKF